MQKDTLYKFFSGTASLEEETEIKEWMESSGKNRKEFFRERKIFDAILLSDEDNIYNPAQKSATPRIPSFIKELLKIAAIIALTLSGSFFFQKTINEPIGMNEITVPPGQRVNLTLPDGTNVWLNARSVLRYPSSYADDKREVTLDGEAYFTVTKNEEIPFFVNTGKYTVKVLGTQFNVNAHKNNEHFETALIEGSVEVLLPGQPEHSIELTPHHKVSEINGILTIEQITDYDTFRWKEGLICFKNQSFAEIMEKFEQTYGIRFIVKNQQVMKYMYTGKFRHADGVDYALRVLQKNINFKFERDDENLIIYIR